jgi:hypothetical protein
MTGAPLVTCMHMNPRRLHLLIAAAALLLAAGVAAVAFAAPNRTGTLSAASTTYSWDGGPLSGAVVLVEDDDTLLKLDAGGDLAVAIEGPGDGLTDLDLYLYASDASGTQGKELKSAATGSDSEKVSVTGLEPGYYLARTESFTALKAMYKGKATLTPSGPAAAPGPVAATDTPPDATIGKLAKSSKASKLKKFSGTAKDDKGVKKVEIALVKKQGAKCTQMTASGSFKALAKCAAPTSFLAAKGTTSWSYKLKKALKKGSYELFARATDNAGHKQQGFSPKSHKAFKVK